MPAGVAEKRRDSVEPTQATDSLTYRYAHGFRLLRCDALHGKQLFSDLGVSDWSIPALVCYREAPLACTRHNVDLDAVAPQLPGSTSGLRVYMPTLPRIK